MQQASTTTAARTADAPGHIVEIHGLRGVALLLVVVFHLFGDGRVSGGVDVFLLVSGFLATASLLRAARRGGTSLRSRYGGYAARLVPPALLVLVFVAIAALTVLPVQDRVQTGREIVASALYVENWELIASQLTYDAAGPTTSPVQHYWSLAVQGQFLLLWPLVVTCCALLARRRSLHVEVVVGVVAAAGTAVSFALAAYLVEVDQPAAYFHSGARFWELGVGALLAVVLPRVGLADRLRDVLAWTGLALVVLSGAIVDGAAHYPGPWALVPVAGAVLVLLGAGSASGRGPRSLLETPPLRFVARISYSLYLWHWPVLIVYLAVREQPAVGWRGAAGVLALSLLLAWATAEVVEVRGRALLLRRGPARAGVVAVGATAALCVVVAGATVVERHRVEDQLVHLADVSPDHPGAAVLDAGFSGPDSWTAPPRPAPGIASKDAAPSNSNGCAEDSGPGHAEVRFCSVHAPSDPVRTVVLLGASHVVQYEPAFEAIGIDQDWRVLTLSKSGCHFARTDARTEDSCAEWNAGALDAVVELDPDLVVVLGTVSRRDGTDRVVASHVDGWRDLTEAGLRVVTLRDNPRFDRSPPLCLRDTGLDGSCGKSRDVALAEESPLVGHPDVPDSVEHVDLSPWICDGDRCPAVVGNVLVYRDKGHLSATYVRSLVPYLDSRLRDRTPWMYERATADPP